MVKVYPGEFSLIDLMAVGSHPGIRTATTPFGAPLGQRIRYVGKAVEWKGKKGEAFWSIAEKHGRLVEGLRTAIHVSREARGTYGVALVQLPYGGLTILPLKVVKQMIAQGKITRANVIESIELPKSVKELKVKGVYKGLLARAVPGVARVPI